jgi:hypothetical protein
MSKFNLYKTKKEKQMSKFNIYTEDEQGRDLFVSAHKTMNLALDAMRRLEIKHSTWYFEIREQESV